MNLPNIVDFHSQLIEITYELDQEGIRMQTLKKLLVMMPYFQLYYEYCQNHQRSSERLNELMQPSHPKFKHNAFFATFKPLEKTPGLKNLDLNSLIVMPCQRITKYPLLFRELLKNSFTFDPCYQQLKTVLYTF